MSKYKKKILSKIIHTESLEDGNLDDIISVLLHWKEQYPNEELRVEYGSCGLDPYGGYDEYYIIRDCLETDEEFNTRVQYEEDKLRTKEQKEMERLLRCKTLNESNKEKLIKYIEKYK